MTRRRIILSLIVACTLLQHPVTGRLAFGQYVAAAPSADRTAQPATGTVSPSTIYPATGAPAVTIPGTSFAESRIASGPVYLQPSQAVIQPAPSLVPIYGVPTSAPPNTTVVPLPSHAPGSIFGPPPAAPPYPPAPDVPAAPVGPLYDLAPGGMVSPQFGFPVGPDAAPLGPSTITIPIGDEELVWDQVADVISDYFKIATEQRVRRGGQFGSEGRIETAPQEGATWLEPHRRDSVGEFNRWESTFQTIRRRAIVRVIPDAAGYTIEVIVEKELEHMRRPERSTAGAATFRNDGSLPSRRTDPGIRTHGSARWIPLGRDPPLEQRILADIHARFAGATTAANPTLWP